MLNKQTIPWVALSESPLHMYVYQFINCLLLGSCSIHTITQVWGLTKMRPVVVCPEMSSPAQSLASVTHPISASGPAPPPWPGGLEGLPCLTTAAFRWQQSHANMRHDNTSSKPTKKVMRLEHRKAYQCRLLKHSSCGVKTTPLVLDVSEPPMFTRL